jgi:hypothetical protein
MLRAHQFTYDVARNALHWYIGHIHHLIDIPPRRLIRIAEAFRDHQGESLELTLQRMLRPTNQRPRLRIPTAWGVDAMYAKLVLAEELAGQAKA